MAYQREHGTERLIWVDEPKKKRASKKATPAATKKATPAATKKATK